MKNKGGFFSALRTVSYDPVYLIFILLLIIYAFTGSLSEAALILLSLTVSVCLRSYYSCYALSPALSEKRGENEKQKKKRGMLNNGFAKLSSILAFVFAAASVPLMIFELLRPSYSDFSSVFANILAVLSLGLAIPGAKDGSAMDYAAARMLHGRDGLLKGIDIKSADAAECLASCDTALILQPSVFYDRTAEIRALWYSATVYRESGLFESGLGLPAEKCAALSMVLMNLQKDVFTYRQSHEDAVLRFHGEQSDSRFTYLASCTFGEPYLNFPGTGDVSLLLNYKTVPVRKELLIRSASSEILNHCSHYRLNDGSTAELSDRYYNDISDQVNRMTEEGLTVYYIVTAPSDILVYGQSSDYILEAIPAVGGTFPEGNSDAVAALEDFGVRPVLVLPGDNATVRNFASECGLSGGTGSVMSFEEFSREPAGSPVEKTHNVFVGFTAEAITSLARKLHRGGSEIAAVVRKRSDMSVMNDSLVSVAVESSSDSETCSLSDSVIPDPSERGKEGGIPGLFSLFSLSVSVCSRLFMIRNMMLSYMAVLTAAVVFPILADAVSLYLSSKNVLFLGAVFTFAVVRVMSEEEMYMRSRKCFEDRVFRDRLNILKYCGMGLLSAAAIAVFGVLFFAGNPVTGRCFVNSALLMSGPAVILAERLDERSRLGIGGINLIYIIYTLLSLILCMGICFIGSGVFASDAADAEVVNVALKTMLLSLIPALVPLMFCGISCLIGKANSTRR